MFTIFWDTKEILLIDCKITGVSIMLEHFPECNKEIRRKTINSYVPAHKSRYALAELHKVGFHILNHP